MKKALQITHMIQMTLGLIVTGYMVLFMSVMATDAPGSGIIQAIFGGIFALLIVGSITLYLPYKSMKELDDFKENNKLFFNYLNILAVFIFFFPLAILQVIFLLNLKK